MTTPKPAPMTEEELQAVRGGGAAWIGEATLERLFTTLSARDDRIKELEEDNTHLHMAAQGIAHYRRCPRNAATRGTHPDPCLWCELEDARARIKELEERRWGCKAKRTADPPIDCDFPFCGCDPGAARVIDALQESGWDPLRYTPEAMRDALAKVLGEDDDRVYTRQCFYDDVDRWTIDSRVCDPLELARRVLAALRGAR